MRVQLLGNLVLWEAEVIYINMELDLWLLTFCITEMEVNNGLGRSKRNLMMLMRKKSLMMLRR